MATPRDARNAGSWHKAWILLGALCATCVVIVVPGCPPTSLPPAPQVIELPAYDQSQVVDAPEGGAKIIARHILIDFVDSLSLDDIDKFLENHRLQRVGWIEGLQVVTARILDDRSESAVRDELQGMDVVQQALLNYVMPLDGVSGAQSPVILAPTIDPKVTLTQNELQRNWPHYVMDTLPALAVADAVLKNKPAPNVVLGIVDSGFQFQTVNAGEDAAIGTLLNNVSGDTDLVPKVVDPTGWRSDPNGGLGRMVRGPVDVSSNSLIGRYDEDHGLAVSSAALSMGQDLLGVGRHVRFRPIQGALMLSNNLLGLPGDYVAADLKFLADENDPNLRVLNLSFGFYTPLEDTLKEIGDLYGPLLDRLVAGNRIVVIAAGNSGGQTQFGGLTQLGPTRDRTATPRRGGVPRHAGILVVGGTALPGFIPDPNPSPNPSTIAPDYPGVLDFAGFQERWMNYSIAGYAGSITSHTGPHIGVTAPGAMVPYLHFNFKDVKLGLGTSFSAPYVSGLAAEMCAVDPTATNVDVVELIEKTADDIEFAGPDDRTGFGRINCWKAILSLINRTDPAKPKWMGVRYRWNMPNLPAPDVFRIGGTPIPDAMLKRVPAVRTSDNSSSVPWTGLNNPPFAYEVCFSFETTELDKSGDIALLEAAVGNAVVHQVPIRRSDLAAGRFADTSLDDFVLTMDILAPTASIYGRATAAGQPVAGAEVHYTARSGQAATAITDADGWYTIYDALPGAPFDIFATTPTLDNIVDTVTVPAFKAIRRDFALEPQFACNNQGSLSAWSSDFIFERYTEQTPGKPLINTTNVAESRIVMSGLQARPTIHFGLRGAKKVESWGNYYAFNYAIAAENGTCIASPVHWGDYGIPGAPRNPSYSNYSPQEFPTVAPPLLRGEPYRVSVQALQDNPTDPNSLSTTALVYFSLPPCPDNQQDCDCDNVGRTPGLTPFGTDLYYFVNGVGAPGTGLGSLICRLALTVSGSTATPTLDWIGGPAVSISISPSGVVPCSGRFSLVPITAGNGAAISPPWQYPNVPAGFKRDCPATGSAPTFVSGQTYNVQVNYLAGPSNVQSWTLTYRVK